MPSKAKVSGSVVAGFPSPAEQYLEPPLDLNELLVKRPAATFFVRVQGDSMIGEGIHDGDLLVVDRSLRPASGDVIIACVDGDFTVKTLRLGNGERGMGKGEWRRNSIGCGQSQLSGHRAEVWARTGLLRESDCLYPSVQERKVIMVNDYRDLDVWKMSMTLCESVYDLIRSFPPDERYALCDQLRRAVVSIPSNIAEGNGRDSKTEYARFPSIAKGSLNEVQTQLELAERFKYIVIPVETKTLITRISKMLFSMMRKLRT